MNSDVLINQLKLEIYRAQTRVTRCPTCLKAITLGQRIVFVNRIFYHSRCRPLRGT